MNGFVSIEEFEVQRMRRGVQDDPRLTDKEKADLIVGLEGFIRDIWNIGKDPDPSPK